jgi:glycosyltransferase involved in cell wall biosynthesis
MARGDRVIAISHFIADLIRTRHGVEESRLRVIPRGVDPRRFDPALVTTERCANLRAAWGLPEGRPIIMLPARVTRWKGQMVLVEAMARLPGDSLALLVGDAEERPAFRAELLARIESLGLKDRVRLVGHANDMPAALLLADVVIHASTDAEAFGRTVIEAQAMARPVIASDLGAPRETVAEGVTGWRTPPGDATALADAIGKALSLPSEERAALGARARAAVLSGYTTAAMQAATMAVYREVLR